MIFIIYSRRVFRSFIHIFSFFFTVIRCCSLCFKKITTKINIFISQRRIFYFPGTAFLSSKSNHERSSLLRLQKCLHTSTLRPFFRTGVTFAHQLESLKGIHSEGSSSYSKVDFSVFDMLCFCPTSAFLRTKETEKNVLLSALDIIIE